MSTDPALNAAATPTVTVTASSPNGAVKAFNHDDGPSFSDVLDILNPLQHIPIINTIYQHLTGDTEGAVADVAGGTLWTGPIGLVGSLVDLAVKSDTGKSISDNLLSWLGFEDDDEPVKAAQAQAAQQQEAEAAVTSAPPAVTVQALAPLPVRQRSDDRKDSDRKSDKDAPAQIGNYMVFGGAGSGAPLALTPAQPAQPVLAAGPRQQGKYMVFGDAPAPQQEQAQPQTARAAAPIVPAAFQMAGASAAQASAAYTKQGNYMVFGASGAAAPAPVMAAAAASPLPPIASAKVDAVANSVPNGGGPAQLSPLPQGRSFSAPARRTQVTPNALPMPTTGPAAAHGYMPSQAIPATATGSDSDSWFVQALNAGLDKYAAAQRLSGQDDLPASAATGAQSATLH